MLEEIIERLKNLPQKENRGGYLLLKHDLEYYRKNKEDHDYYSLSGFIWGLYAVEIITLAECQKAHEELIAI